MIRKDDLRVGNWVMNIDKQYIQISCGAMIDDAENFYPILLNEALLVKCGFTYEQYFHVWQKKQTLPKTGFLLEMDKEFNVRDFGQRFIGVQLTSLHHLQNLLYFLRRVELLVDMND